MDKYNVFVINIYSYDHPWLVVDGAVIEPETVVVVSGMIFPATTVSVRSFSQ